MIKAYVDANHAGNVANRRCIIDIDDDARMRPPICHISCMISIHISFDHNIITKCLYNMTWHRVGLLNKFGKKVSMVCHPCRLGAGNRTEDAYGRRVTGVGRSYAERQQERVARGECGEVLAVRSMSSHLMNQHGKAASRRQLWNPQADGGPRTYKMSFPAKGGMRRCPVEGCPGALATRTAMRVHFVHRHVHDTVVILEEGNLPLPRCPR